jgi:hypothetical protein
MAAPYPGVYRAKAQRLDGTKLTANVPQVFGEQDVIITAFVGSPPTSSEMGWVAFHGGRPEFPVWLGVGTGGGGGGGGGGTVTDTLWVGPSAPTDASIEMWWDTDEDADLDLRYATPAYVDARTPKRYGASGTAGFTSGTTPRVACSLTIPAQSINGSVYFSAMLRINKAVATDLSSVDIVDRPTTTIQAQDYPCLPANGTTQYHSVLSGAIGTTAGVALILDLRVARQAGTGNAETYAAGAYNRIDGLWFPG